MLKQHSWFEKLTGTSEDTKNINNCVSLERNKFTNELEIHCYAPTPVRYQVGDLTTPTLDSIRSKVKAMRATRLQKPNSINEIVADVQDLYTMPENDGALFQVASQFNALEMANPDLTPEDGVTIYEDDHTQGPASAIACGAATIYRNYFHPPINTLHRVEEFLHNNTHQYWVMKNGYAIINYEKLDELTLRFSKQKIQANDISLREFYAAISTRKVMEELMEFPLQENTTVTLGMHNHFNHVDQIFCSALPVAYNEEPNDPRYQPLAELILRAAYEATLSMAYLKNKKVYLTLLGGGAFGNKEEWIINALEEALRAFHHQDLKISIVSHKTSNPAIQNLIQREKDGTIFDNL